MVGLHTKPTNTMDELLDLENVYKALKSQTRVVFLGDFNADCNYLKNIDKSKIPFLFNPAKSGMYMLSFKDNEKTNLLGTCAYDKIVVSKSVYDEVQGKQAEVGTFDRVPSDNKRVCCIIYAMSLHYIHILGWDWGWQLDAVSDHYPIKMTLEGNVPTHLIS